MNTNDVTEPIIDDAFFHRLLDDGMVPFISACNNAAFASQHDVIDGMLQFLERHRHTLGDMGRFTAHLPEHSGDDVHDLETDLTHIVFTVCVRADKQVQLKPKDLNPSSVLQRYVHAIRPEGDASAEHHDQALFRFFKLFTKMHSWSRCDQVLDLDVSGALTNKVPLKERLFAALANHNFARATSLVNDLSPEAASTYVREATSNQADEDDATSSIADHPMQDFFYVCDERHRSIKRGFRSRPEDAMDFLDTLWGRAAEHSRAWIPEMAMALIAMHIDFDKRSEDTDEVVFSRLLSGPFASDLANLVNQRKTEHGRSIWEQVKPDGDQCRSLPYLHHAPELLRQVLAHGVEPLFDLFRPMVRAAARDHEAIGFEQAILPPMRFAAPLSGRPLDATLNYLAEEGHDINRTRQTFGYEDHVSVAKACTHLHDDELKHILPALLEHGLDADCLSSTCTSEDNEATKTMRNIVLAFKAKQAATDLLASLTSNVQP